MKAGGEHLSINCNPSVFFNQSVSLPISFSAPSHRCPNSDVDVGRRDAFPGQMESLNCSNCFLSRFPGHLKSDFTRIRYTLRSFLHDSQSLKVIIAG